MTIATLFASAAAALAGGGGEGTEGGASPFAGLVEGITGADASLNPNINTRFQVRDVNLESGGGGLGINSTFLIVGAGIIAFLIFRKRK